MNKRTPDFALSQLELFGQQLLHDQRAIGRFLGNGIRPVMGSTSAKADAAGGYWKMPRASNSYA